SSKRVLYVFAIARDIVTCNRTPTSTLLRLIEAAMRYLICALKNPEKYKSVSAFAPIAAPMRCQWGQKAFSNYLGSDRETWRAYDASELVLTSNFKHPILIDQGTVDPFLEKQQLLPEVFKEACEKVAQPLTLRFQEGYNHSYYFIASFIEDHIRHHVAALCD
ncbi:MAG: hypothetical protein F6K28_55995, partial [Microcoleus sp. SIO2G3]|nr:hypothetical protein [Microcoleus sp. SIO2G3]